MSHVKMGETQKCLKLFMPLKTKNKKLDFL